jgi:hypothetical protein
MQVPMHQNALPVHPTGSDDSGARLSYDDWVSLFRREADSSGKLTGSSSLIGSAIATLELLRKIDACTRPRYEEYSKWVTRLSHSAYRNCGTVATIKKLVLQLDGYLSSLGPEHCVLDLQSFSRLTEAESYGLLRISIRNLYGKNPPRKFRRSKPLKDLSPEEIEHRANQQVSEILSGDPHEGVNYCPEAIDIFTLLGEDPPDKGDLIYVNQYEANLTRIRMKISPKKPDFYTEAGYLERIGKARRHQFITDYIMSQAVTPLIKRRKDPFYYMFGDWTKYSQKYYRYVNVLRTEDLSKWCPGTVLSKDPIRIVPPVVVPDPVSTNTGPTSMEVDVAHGQPEADLSLPLQEKETSIGVFLDKAYSYTESISTLRNLFLTGMVDYGMIRSILRNQLHGPGPDGVVPPPPHLAGYSQVEVEKIRSQSRLQMISVIMDNGYSYVHAESIAIQFVLRAGTINRMSMDLIRSNAIESVLSASERLEKVGVSPSELVVPDLPPDNYLEIEGYEYPLRLDL